MRSTFCIGKGVFGLTGAVPAAVVALVGGAGAAMGQYVPLALDVPGVRTPLPGEGYLIHKPNPFHNPARFGDEYTGWIDVRHPARASSRLRSTGFGFDMSDHLIRVRTTTLTDRNGVTATPNIERDFNFANRTYLSQAGLSVVETAHRNYTSGNPVPGGNPVNFTFPIATTVPAQNATDSQFGLAANNLTGGPGTRTVDVYYHGELDNDPANAYRGYAYFSGVAGRPDGGAGAFRPFIGMATQGSDTAVADTFAHELGHFMLNGPSVDNPIPGDPAHSGTRTNLMAPGSQRWYPGIPANDFGAGNPPSAIPESLDVVGPTMALNTDGTPRVGGINQWTGGTTPQSQLRRVFDAAGNPTTTNYFFLAQNRSAGDRIDFDFVADVGRTGATGGTTSLLPGTVDGVSGADNFPGPSVESMYWGIGGSNPGYTVTLPTDVDKDKTGLPTAAALGNFAGPNFYFIDVISLTTYYGDSDTDVTRTFRDTREGSLDYRLILVDAAFNQVDAIPLQVFVEGWSTDTFVEDYVARWVAPAGFHPVALYIFALDGMHNGVMYDGHAQIDAIIVAIPEPAGIGLGLGVAAALASRRRR